MSTKAEEIGIIIKEQIKNYKTRIEMNETGSVVFVGDGIAGVYGIRDCMASELLEFDRFRKKNYLNSQFFSKVLDLS